MNTNETRNQLSIAIVKKIFQEMFSEQKLLQERLQYLFTITVIISSNTTRANWRLGQPIEKMDKNAKVKNAI